MNIDQLRYLAEINKCKSITQASENLHISHQALSASIKSLEKELDTNLLKKSPRGTKLTIKGKQLLDISKDFIADLDELFFPEYNSQTQSCLSIAGSYVSITNFLALHLHDIISSSPTCNTTFLEYPNSHDICTAIETGIADVGFCAVFNKGSDTKFDFQKTFLHKFPSLECHYVSTLKIFCELSPMHPLSYLEQIPLSKLQKYQLLYFYPRLPLQDMQSNMVESSFIYNFVQYFKQFDFSIESNPTFYAQAIQKNNYIGITIAETATSPYDFLRIPLASECHFEIFSICCLNSQAKQTIKIL